jgi:sensor histidine kinase regulating citrate/malate metabolism
MKRTKPTNYEAAKRTVTVGEKVTAENMVERLIDNRRREIPTKRSLAANMKKDRDFIVVSNKRGPTVFQRIA